MMVSRYLVFLLSIAAVGAAQSLLAECQRYGHNSSSSDWFVYTNDAYCATRAYGCLLNTATCTSVNAAAASMNPNNQELKLPLCNAVGNIALSNASTLDLTNQDFVEMKDAVLPPSLEYLTIARSTVTGLVDPSQKERKVLPDSLTQFFALRSNLGTLSAAFTWPSSLLELYLTNAVVRSMPQIIAPALRNLVLINVTAPLRMLDLVPTQSVASMTLQDATLTSIVDRNWSNTQFLDLSNNRNLSTLFNVTLSPGLRYFGCFNCSLTNITVHQSTFEAFNRLEIAFPETSSPSSGFGYDKPITTDAAACAALQGSVQKLQPLQRFLNVELCVLPDPNPAIPLEATPEEATTHTGLIVGCTIGGLVVVGLLVAYGLRRRANDAHADGYYYCRTINNATDGTGDYSEMGLNVDDLRMHKLDVGDYVVTGKKPLASGAFGEVWLGAYGNDKVAIKRIKDRRVESVRKFIDEITLMAKMDSDFIVAFVGVGWRRPIEIEVVVEYMDLGDLRNYLRTTSAAQFDWRQKASTIMSIVRGLVYLHTFEPAIIHRDLKSRNVLLDAKKGTKLTDFGASREASDANMTNGIGTYQWMAPEVIMGTDYTIAADIYSFGVILSELSTHAVPYGDEINPATGRAYTQQAIMTKVTSGKLRPTFESVTTPTWVRKMGHQCLAASPDDRPTALLLTSMVQCAMSQSV
ncbi:TKL protein kinase [Saprolegnia diclina VS20]|uniref:TKL protein kinase n=1 Tax=Saprolegnia diclina (strain VS20) TaxID=1156394 RepID=T0RDH2_SAPDV|nr:TKL protein kinase [Saprolegnia diclina VS20]EQC27642.1 TKL protein kinase [Saprolegnia diclina VS20]|eukprot:XP_008618910.1 TKL protein kinase [Saprolegnia diclina VS20]